MLRALFLMGLAIYSFSPHTAYANDEAVCARNEYGILLSAIHSNLRTAISPTVKNFLVDLYKRAGISIEESQITLSNPTNGLMGPYFTVKVEESSKSTAFNITLWTSPGVTNLTTSNNAKWDPFGNLISPATEVTCTADQNYYVDVMAFSNSSTGHRVGTAKMPNKDGMRCNERFGCFVGATVTIGI